MKQITSTIQISELREQSQKFTYENIEMNENLRKLSESISKEEFKVRDI